MTRSAADASDIRVEPSDKFDFSVFGKVTPLNPKNELLLAHLRGDEDFEEQLVEYHSRGDSYWTPISKSGGGTRRASFSGGVATPWSRLGPEFSNGPQHPACTWSHACFA